MKLSVITPSFNQGEFIERTVQSVLTQTHSSYELEYIVMDGGSTDQTVDVLKQYADQLTWTSEPDKGQAHAVNKGLQVARGDIIGWLNSDDLYYSGTLKKIVDFFAAHPQVDIVYGDANFIDKEDKVTGLYPTENWNVERFKSCCYLSQPATFFRRSIIAKHGYLDEDLHFCMDYEYWLRLALQGATFAYLPGVLSATRLYAETKTTSGFLKANLEAIQMVKKHVGEIPAEWVVSNGGALTRAKYGYQYPEWRFILSVWLNLWQTAGQYQQGLPRLTLWMAAQKAMLMKFIRRSLPQKRL